MRYAIEGKVIKLMRYIVTWEEPKPVNEYEKDPVDAFTHNQDVCFSEDAYQALIAELEDKGITYKTDKIDNDGYEWIDGVELPVGSNEEAEKVISMGEEQYRYKKSIDERTSPEQMRADIDLIMIVGDLL